MNKCFKEWFALTDKGASDLVRSSLSSFFVFSVNLFPSMLLLFLIDDLLSENPFSNGFYVFVSLVILGVMYFLLRTDYESLYNAVYKESANLRLDIADILRKLPLSYFSRHDLSDLSQTVMSDVENLEHAMAHAMSKVIGFFMFFPIMAILLLVGNVKMGVACVLPILISLGLLFLSKKLQVSETHKYYQKRRDNSENFQEAIELQQEIKSFGLVAQWKEDLYRKMDESEKIHFRSEIFQGIPLFLATWITQLSLGIVIVSGAFLFQASELSLIYFIGYILFSTKIKEGVDAIFQNLAELFYLDSSIRRMKALRETKQQEGMDQEIKNYDIELQHVSFAYDKNNPILKDINFTANQNEVTALVGMSGCGKTSILRLVSRLYDYNEGEIKIGGHNIKDVSTKSLFNKISVVFQDVTLFNTSIMENIRLGRTTASDEEVRHAARLANCEEFIDRLPNGYDTVIGENGATLSGGERQRLSIARAFLKDAPVIILDEISASLDVDNEKKIQDSLNKLIKNKTVLIISHRLKSVENADKIVVIDEGKVEASGKHDALLKESKIYLNLVQKAKQAEEFNY
ncbi:TPA: ABC transporter ATP-binding protein [Salmonella enterica]|uniref:ABC transporter ATP-binding protein n=1 Tax=Salmonella enterica TaxID=28901 RepID=A0A760BG90_SALER|nr:ABC transporter ATP-binding protein [Salmonella enterica subsp. enterica serovar Newport]HAG2284639.1 ABC transporter ATP-binding protein [Salmonella enterica]